MIPVMVFSLRRGVWPGLRRASARTKDWARETALEAMPYHTALQRMWQIASIDLAAISPKSFGRICATSPSAPLKNPATIPSARSILRIAMPTKSEL